MRRQISYSTYSDIGKRPVNEDSAGVFQGENGSLFVVCDGLGGHGMGDAASSLVVEKLGKAFEESGRKAFRLGEEMTRAQEALLEEQKKLRAQKKMKTTAVCLKTDEKTAEIAWVGDSRVYVFAKDKVLRRTADHSIPQMLVYSGEIKESEIRFHPDRSTILRVMGVEWETPQYEEIRLPLRRCQAFLLCTDGFWEWIEEAEMEQLLAESESAEAWLEKMSRRVREKGEGSDMDNQTAIAVWVETK